jgi:hypothetical protein
VDYVESGNNVFMVLGLVGDEDDRTVEQAKCGGKLDH